MKRTIISAAICAALFSSAATAQRKGSGAPFPDTWGGEKSLAVKSDCVTAEGDFNMDGFKDIAVIAVPRDPAFMRTHEDGYAYNFNKPVLAVFFGQKKGKPKLHKEYRDTIPGNDAENEDCFHESSLSVNDEGDLCITVSEFYSEGSSDSPSFEYVFRWQDGDFFLIGRNYGSFSRYSGEAMNVSENYLTHKRRTVTYNMFDEDVPEEESWTELFDAPLQKLGSELLTVSELDAVG